MKWLLLATGAPWCVSNRQIHEDLGVPLFDDIRALTASFDSKVVEVDKPLVRQLDRYAERGINPSPDA
jgi:predicted aspartyl protease